MSSPPQPARGRPTCPKTRRGTPTSQATSTTTRREAPTSPSTPLLAEALRRVYDPCSQAWSRPLSIYDLGLVRAASVDADGCAHVTISLTAPFCMAIATIMQATEQRVGELPGVTAVDVQIDTETPWGEHLMTGDGRRWLAERRRADQTRASTSAGIRAGTRAQAGATSAAS